MDGSLVGLTVALTTEFVTSSDGSMAAIVGNCSTIIVRSHFNLHPVGPMGLFVKNLEALINDGIARRIPDLLCNRLKRLIEGQTPRLLRRLTRLDVGKNVAERIVTENPAVNDFISNLVDGLYIDNANVAQPIITDDFLETQNRGEFRYNRQTELSPFFPKPMRITTKSDRMLHFYASDYLFNSMLYHAYQMNNLHMQFSADNLPKEFGSFLSTTCAPRELCIGRMIPPLGKRFPNTTASFVLISHGLPDFKFSNDSAIVQLSMRVLTYVKENGRQRQVIVSSADGDAEVLLSVEGDNLSGELKLRTLDVRLHRTAIEGIHSQSFAQLAPLAKTFIGPHLSDALKRGIPFPLKDMMKLVDPKVRRHEGFIELSTDFQLNESAFRKTVRETFADVNV
ncbi:unnamed protein product [Caenorhabditis auriculariae]|uniref:Lipid-binding serum glycoprotein C-terminal domain-containing protein n=1 Tax=Caenorhabditis auriculariae TaxID=2777116 RepID=A0A8S1HGL7_9PELO|nr:unnamed protein product [Caenorhabditis auriculariae]